MEADRDTGEGDVATGDAELEALFRSSYAGLVRALAVACGDADLAADAVQDAFIQASRHWRRVRTFDAPELWLRRVAVNRLSNRSRGNRRHRSRIARLAAEPVPEAEPPDGARLDVRDALADLAEGQRLAICLHYLADLSVAEVARVLDVSPGTVKSQLYDGRQRLLRLLEVNDGS